MSRRPSRPAGTPWGRAWHHPGARVHASGLIVPAHDTWLARVFHPDHLQETLDALVASQTESVADQARLASARRPEREFRLELPPRCTAERSCGRSVQALGDLVGVLRALSRRRRPLCCPSLGLSLTYEPSKRRGWWKRT